MRGTSATPKQRHRSFLPLNTSVFYIESVQYHTRAGASLKPHLYSPKQFLCVCASSGQLGKDFSHLLEFCVIQYMKVKYIYKFYYCWGGFQSTLQRNLHETYMSLPPKPTALKVLVQLMFIFNILCKEDSVVCVFSRCQAYFALLYKLFQLYLTNHINIVDKNFAN